MLQDVSHCQACQLCKNQAPLVETPVGSPSVVFTGLSAVASECVDSDRPFSPATRSGRLLRDIEEDLGHTDVYFTNLVKCLPLRDGKIRYPSNRELEACFPNYDLELRELAPVRVVLLGRQVSGFVASKLGLEFVPVRALGLEGQIAQVGDVQYLSTYHPSYVLVYRRRRLAEYKASICAFVNGGRAQLELLDAPNDRAVGTGVGWALAT